jgi:hypothetical protein
MNAPDALTRAPGLNVQGRVPGNLAFPGGPPETLSARANAGQEKPTRNEERRRNLEPRHRRIAGSDHPRETAVSQR